MKNFGANFGANFGDSVSNFTTFFGNFVQQRAVLRDLTNTVVAETITELMRFEPVSVMEPNWNSRENLDL